jgi:hypothetical protein
MAMKQNIIVMLAKAKIALTGLFFSLINDKINCTKDKRDRKLREKTNKMLPPGISAILRKNPKRAIINDMMKAIRKNLILQCLSYAF